MLLGELSAAGFDGSDDAQVLEFGRMQLVRKLHVARDLSAMLPDFLQLLLRARWSPIPVGMLKLHGQQRQPLANVVMQVAGNTCTLLLLRFDQATALRSPVLPEPSSDPLCRSRNRRTRQRSHLHSPVVTQHRTSSDRLHLGGEGDTPLKMPPVVPGPVSWQLARL